MGVPRTGLHAGTRFSIRSDQNGTKYTTLDTRYCSRDYRIVALLFLKGQMPY